MNNSLRTKTNLSFEKELIHIPSVINELCIIRTNPFQILLKERFNSSNSIATINNDTIPFLSFFKYKNNNAKESLISFDSFYSNETLIQLLTISQAKLSIIACFKSKTNLHFTKTLLLHLLIAFINFNSKIEDRLIPIYQSVFAKCLCPSLINNYSEIFNMIMKKQELHMTNIKYKTFYLIDLSSNIILFNLSSFHKKKINRIENNDGIWKDILYHSHNLMMEYNTANKKKQNAFYSSSDHCVKLECRAAFPRYTFIIKFLPVIHGISLVHVYLQKKLSNISDGNDSGSKFYKEYDVIYESEQKKSERSIEFKYVEPLQIKRIEQFFVNYFTTTSSVVSLYCADKYELKYFDSLIIRQINQMIKKNDQGINNELALIQKIKAEFYNEAIELKKKHDEEQYDLKEENEELNVINFIDFLYFSKEKFLKLHLKHEDNKMNQKDNDQDTDLNKCKIEANEVSLSFNNKLDNLGLVDNKTNLTKTKSIFMLDITGIQKVNDDLAEGDISNIYPTRAKENEFNEACLSSGRDLFNNDGGLDIMKTTNRNWDVSSGNHGKELSFRHSHYA